MVFFIVSYLPERKYKIYGSVRPPINQKTSMLFKSSIKLRQSGEFPGLSFKYISCYSLSWGGRNMIRATFKFKYISCYSLSPVGCFVSFRHLYLNTSHVILYHAHFQRRKNRSRI